MKKIIVLLFLAGLTSLMQAQQTVVSGVVRDAQTGETLFGATVMYGPARGTVADYDGKFSLRLDNGKYTFNFSYVGYEPEVREFELTGKPVILEIDMRSLTIDEVVIVADMAISRETPVAFTNVNPAQIQEELAGQDLPMILNTTPGVYATQQGGGDGDARITIRGFDQRNLAVMIDGIPVNDMENGWVYWSNWFGLDLVTRTMQVQRGLGASQLALPSVGGTINILTKGIENKRQTTFKQSIDSQGKLQSNFGFTSGKLPHGWGITLAGAYKKGNGWVDNTFSEGWFYYAKIDKRLNKHLFTLTAMGAPQMHDQRSYTRPISAYDTVYAEKLGIDLSELRTANDQYNIYGAGVGYNQHWGTLRRNKDNPDAPEEVLSERTNEYHKPQFTLQDFWTISDRLTISNNLYLSVGKGGGVRPKSSVKDTRIIMDPEDPNYGQIDWQGIYNDNWKPQPPLNLRPVNPTYDDSLTYASNYMIRQNNEHYWVGLLSKVNYRISQNLKLSGGIDLRSYRGIHYTTIRDLLGGDYAIDMADTRRDYVNYPLLAMKYVGDTVIYNYYEGKVRWGGIFGQLEYSVNRFSAFVNLTTAVSGYNKIDYFDKSESGWIYKQGFTVKSGSNFNLSDASSIYMNIGYLSRVRPYNYFYSGYTTNFAEELDNELIKAVELGYNYASTRFSMQMNAYFTRWDNKPTNRIYSSYNLQAGDPGYIPDDPDANSEQRVYADIPGMNARHMGIEVDFAYKILHNLELQGTISLGDWIWDSYIQDLQFYLEENSLPVQKQLDFDARGIHVGDAAQTQLGTSIRYEPLKGVYLNLRQTYFGKYYSNFTPEATTNADGEVQDSWVMPDFNLFDFHAGYNFRIKVIDAANFNIRFSLLNVLDTEYIWDATNNDSFSPYSEFQSFDARSATVFFGMGRRFTTSLAITF